MSSFAIYDGEHQQLNYLLEADKQATSFELDEIIQMHRRETKKQLSRLEEAFEILDKKPTGESYEGIKGIINETHNLTERCKNQKH